MRSDNRSSLRAQRSNPVLRAALDCFVAALLAMTSVFAVTLCHAQNAEAPGDCLGVDFDPQHPVAIGKVTAANPRVYFVKNATDDAACPAGSAACREKAYLVPGNLTLVGKGFLGKTDGVYTCVSYESANAKKVSWTNGWLPAASLTPVAPAAAPARADWIGNWVHASGTLAITGGAGGALAVHGEAFYAAAQDVHTGVIDATATPAQSLLEFADDGSAPWDKALAAATCLVRMQRVGALLVVEDNGGCGGAMVTFTGFYRRK
jgi:hypothetical protein